MKYRQNDYQFSNRITGQIRRTRADKQARDYQGYYVYPSDAEDIKAHPFFHGLSWDCLHLSRPPFVPDVKGRDDTRYFDDEEEISDVDDMSSCSMVDGAADPNARQENAAVSRPVQVDGAERAQDARLQPRNDEAPKEKGVEDVEGKEVKSAKVKEKKRPRDRVLRDKEVAKRVLEIRKKGAFIGYTYRRPKGISQEGERGRYSISRRYGRTS